MPLYANNPLLSTDVTTTWDAYARGDAYARAPRVARYHGGSKDGQVEALESYQSARHFSILPAIQWYAAESPATVMRPYQTEVYYAQGRTITAADTSAWERSAAATAYTIVVDYVAASTNATAATVASTWNSFDFQYVPAPPLTPEQEATRARGERRKVLAHKRARRLLLNLLSDEQQHEYARSKCFTVIAKDGRVFRLRKGKTAELLGGDGVPVAAYCIHLPYGYNHEDTLVALLLSLQTDPAEFERVANITRLKRPAETVRDMAVGLQNVTVAMREAGQAARYALEHVRESRAMLRAEGLSDAEVESLRQPPNHHAGLVVAA